MKKLKLLLCCITATFFLQKNYAQTASQQSKIAASHSDNGKLSTSTRKSSIQGVLRVHPVNPRYFTDASGRAIYLTGSHTWPSVMDMTGPSGKQTPEDNAFLDWIATYGHNFTKLWTSEADGWIFKDVNPLPFVRSGPGVAGDGKPKYDLTRLNQEYFDRLKSRVRAAYDRGIYVAVFLFGHAGGLRNATPYKIENNSNGVNGDADGDGYAIETRRLQMPAVTALQEAYVKKVIETVNGFDNVLYEIACESDLTTTDWQYHMIRFIRQCEANMPKHHLIGISSDGGYGSGDDTKRLFDSPADWVAPGWDINAPTNYMTDPLVATGHKIVMLDTDHLWGVGGDSKWVWKSFTRGLHPSYMDPYLEFDSKATLKVRQGQFDSARHAMGQTLKIANKLNLAAMTPHNELASTRYCLANPGREYLVYLPEGDEVTVDLSSTSRIMKVQWIHPVEGTIITGKKVAGGSKRMFKAPFGGDAVLHIVTKK